MFFQFISQVMALINIRYNIIEFIIDSPITFGLYILLYRQKNYFSEFLSIDTIVAISTYRSSQMVLKPDLSSNHSQL